MVRHVSLVKVTPRSIAAALVATVLACVWLYVVGRACIESPDVMVGIVIVLPLPLLFMTVAVLTNRAGREHAMAVLQEESEREEQCAEIDAWWRAEHARQEAAEEALAAQAAEAAREAERWAEYYRLRGWDPEREIRRWREDHAQEATA